MAIKYVLVDENSGFVVETPVLIPLRWRTKTKQVKAVSTNNFGASLASPAGIFEYETTTYGSWQDGGNVTLSRQFQNLQNGSGEIARQHAAIVAKPAGGYYSASGDRVYLFTDADVEIDWKTSMEALRTAYSVDQYRIGVLKSADSGGTVDEDIDLVSEGLIDLDLINSYYVDTNTENGNLVNMDLSISYKEVSIDASVFAITEPVVYQGLSSFSVNSLTAGDDYNSAAHVVFDTPGLGNSTTVSRQIPMYIKVWVKEVISFSGSASDLSEPDDKTVKAEDDTDPDNWGTFSGSSGSTSLGSSSQGLNTFYTGFGNGNLPFNSVYLTGASLSSFLAAGGGIISNDGVFPMSQNIYIDKISLSIEGSTMSIVEVVEFDATPSLTLGQVIYGYLLDETNTSRPIFCGFVTSRKRTCSGQTRMIEYECKDLINFLDQLYSPSYYIYSPPSLTGTGVIKTYDRVLREIINVAGLPNTIIDIPETNAPPTEWYYENLTTILEWATKYLGKYVYYVDCYGRLNVRATDSLTNIKTYTIGDKSGEIAIESFNTIVDYERARSSIVLVGDYELKEHSLSITQNINTVQERDPYTNTGSGVFYYTYTKGTTTYKSWYFIWNPGTDIADHLLSDTSKTASVIIDSKTGVDVEYFSDPNRGGLLEPYSLNKELNVQIVTNSSGQKVIFCEDPALYFYGLITIKVKYASKSASPIEVRQSTGLTGGAEVIRRPEFKKVTANNISYDDTELMKQYLTQIQEFYKPVYGGSLQLDGLDTDIYLLAKVSVAGSDLPTVESNNLICYGIEYDVQNKRTTVELSNKVFFDLPFFDTIRERSNEKNVSLAKLGQVEQSELYGRLR